MPSNIDRISNNAVYRKDIDGLRFFAVGSVVIGHYFPSLMPSGFLGVDVFFVISGYVITQLLSSMDTTRLIPFLANFYAKRIRRLAPALLSVISVTLLISFLFVTRVDGAIGNTGAYSLIGLSNMYLWHLSQNYFSLAASQNPFTHTWSLGVEEQFYVIYPLFFLAVNRLTRKNGKKILMYGVGIISLISLISNVILSQSMPNLTFYSMPTRLWELGFGAIVFLSSSKNSWDHEKIKRYRLILLSLMVASFFVDFTPIVSGQIVVTLATALLLFPSSSDATSRILSHRIATWFGVRSYSIYLIHWPLLVLTNYLFGYSIIKNFISIGVTLFLSNVSFMGVESPFRVGRLKSSSLKTICLGMPILLLATATFHYGAPKLSQSYNNLVPHLLGVKDVPVWNPTKCSGAINTKKLENPIQLCLGGSKRSSSRYVYLIGDSHADQLVSMANVAFKSPEYQVRNLNLENGIDFPFGDFLPGANSLSLKYLTLNAKQGDIVILAFHRGLMNPSRDLHIAISEKILITPQTNNLIRNLNRFSNIMSRVGVKIILVEDTPLMKSVQTSQSCALQLKLFGRNGCKVSRIQDSHTRYLQEYAFEEVSKKNTNVQIYDPLNYIYGDSTTFDVEDSGGNYLMWDWNHITQYLSARLAPDFKKCIQDFIG